MFETFSGISFENRDFLDHAPILPVPEIFEKTASSNVKDLFHLYGHLKAKFFPEDSLEAKITKDLEYFEQELKRISKDGDCSHYEKIWADRVGTECVPFCPPDVQEYIISLLEKDQGSFALDSEMQKQIFRSLIQAVVLEKFFHTKYVGQKRFSLEGCETLIPMLYSIFESDVCSDVDEVVIGMSHRGRINVMVNLLQKPLASIFSEFEDVQIDNVELKGDVKYHKGFSCTYTTTKGKSFKATLMSNPSHLESVDPVTLGFARAKELKNNKRVLPILIHGDAALSGQGIVYETLEMSRLEGYEVGGAIHIVVNNHIGFTTLPQDERSTHYCTDIAKAFGFPIFHVNAEDPESSVWIAQFAGSIWKKFFTDVFIDVHCFRKYGHNESDEPLFTQPTIYQKLRQKLPIQEHYEKELLEKGVIDSVEKSKISDEFLNTLNVEFTQFREKIGHEKIEVQAFTESLKDHVKFFDQVDTKVDKNTLLKVAKNLYTVPEGMALHPKLKELLEKKNIERDPIDWATAESLSLGSILYEGNFLRLVGQDTRRGTFSQRHAVWVDQKTAKTHIPLKTCAKDPYKCEIYDSLLSEYAALGYEYGFSVGYPEALVIWEAQFGDFANGAQVVIDQYLACAEYKWKVASRLCLFLPHGYEGQGPEHSSARIERFLSLCAEGNLILVNPTTPAQFFHLLRRQVLRKDFAKPLIVFTPKALLRHHLCISTFEDLTNGAFHEILDDDSVAKENCKRVLLCQGKIYYDLVSERKKLARTDVAIVRIEQLYPLDLSTLESIVQKYSNAKKILWVQEEPYNMGAWSYMKDQISHVLLPTQTLESCARKESPTVASGSHRVHEFEHETILKTAFLP